jgi:hypothetical protein
MLKFNMGCGHRKMAGYVNVDAFAECEPDVVWNLDETPWPWADNCAEQVLFVHALEHMGATTAQFLGIMKELYRICAPDAEIVIIVPHPRHDDFLNDPTHVRPITITLLGLFDRALNEQWRAQGDANSPLALYAGVDFVRTKYAHQLDEAYAGPFQRGEIAADQLVRFVAERNNVIKQTTVHLRARKP